MKQIELDDEFVKKVEKEFADHIEKVKAAAHENLTRDMANHVVALMNNGHSIEVATVIARKYMQITGDAALMVAKSVKLIKQEDQVRPNGSFEVRTLLN